MFAAFGHLSTQMLVHILLMNGVAPFLALAAFSGAPGGDRRGRFPGFLPSRASARSWLFPAMIVQLALLWAWHAPPALDAAMRSDTLHLAMQASLLLCATWFWATVFCGQEDSRWRPILALLVTSKLFCLLGVLLVFAPRVLYPGVLSGPGHAAAHAASALADQQLAGLLMLVACPITYLGAAIVLAARWLGRIDAAVQPSSSWQNPPAGRLTPAPQSIDAP